MSNNDNSKTPIIHIRFNFNDFNYIILTELLELIINTFKMKGLNNIKNIQKMSEQQIMILDNKDGKKIIDSEYVIYTEGINMEDIRKINGVDIQRTACNDIYTIYKKFGIEAAKSALLYEFMTVFRTEGVNYHHLSILVDIITNTGGLTSIDRHGINRLDTDPLSRASFEKTLDQLTQAAVFGEIDYMRSVSSRIMAGIVIKGGTGLCELIMDDNMLENSEYIEVLDKQITGVYKHLTLNMVLSDIINKTSIETFIPNNI